MSERRWDIGDLEPDGVTSVRDLFADEYDDDSPYWGRCIGSSAGQWKGYKNGGKVYLTWDELVRRWGPVVERDPS